MGSDYTATFGKQRIGFICTWTLRGTLYEIALSLRNLERIVGKCNSKQITQNTIDNFILHRGEEVKRPTLNKDLRNLKTFINWCRENRYLNGNLKIKELKEDERPVKSLNSTQIKKLRSAAEHIL